MHLTSAALPHDPPRLRSSGCCLIERTSTYSRSQPSFCPQIPADKCDLLEDLVQKLQKREVRLNRQEFLHKVRDIAGEDAPALRHALKQLAVERSPTAPPARRALGSNGLPPSTELSSAASQRRARRARARRRLAGLVPRGARAFRCLTDPAAALGSRPRSRRGGGPKRARSCRLRTVRRERPERCRHLGRGREAGGGQVGGSGRRWRGEPSVAPAVTTCTPDLAAAIAAAAQRACARRRSRACPPSRACQGRA